MISKPSAVFLINLLQDVNVLRPLVAMAARDFEFDTLLLVSAKFAGRDLFEIWRAELASLQEEFGCRMEVFDSDWDAQKQLTGRGLIFAASESHLHNHVTTHKIFLQAPHSYLKVTLQHGFECVGFRHSVDHDRAHGVTASFGADFVCGWAPLEMLSSMASSQRAKLLVTGPTSLLQMHRGPIQRLQNPPGLVCENLHSVRLNGPKDLKNEFVDTFAEFCRLIGRGKGQVALRPHPGGQYVLKNKTPLPVNASIENAPMYRLDLRRFGYGISAPSSVLVDMVLAGIPTAVWLDPQGHIDADSYAGLATVTTPQDWAEFASAALRDPAPFLEQQQGFLKRSGMPLDAETVYREFAQLFMLARRFEPRPIGAVQERERILFVASGDIPTLQLSFTKPLESLVGRGEITSRLLGEAQVRSWEENGGDELGRSIQAYLDGFDPSVIIFCRYSGPGGLLIRSWAERSQVPTIYHIDDDLLAIPADIGAKKFALHNAPERLEMVGELLNTVDLVYASTAKLRARLEDYSTQTPIVDGQIYCSGSAIRQPSREPSRIVGYMASADHAHNLDMILPAIEQLLDANPGVCFELFGSIPIPPALERFGNRIRTAPPIANYQRFLEEFAERNWDIGICPLAPIDFNMMKANTKWVEYSSVGVAVVASSGTVYDDCCADGCGILAATPEEWFAALHRLVNDDSVRIEQVTRAQLKLLREYGIGRLRDQVIGVIARSRSELQHKCEVKKEAVA